MSKKKYLRFMLSLLFVLIFSLNAPLSAYASGHVHSFGGQEQLESIIRIDREYLNITYPEGGNTYAEYTVIAWARFYKSCYCGARGDYTEHGYSYTYIVQID